MKLEPENREDDNTLVQQLHRAASLALAGAQKHNSIECLVRVHRLASLPMRRGSAPPGPALV